MKETIKVRLIVTVEVEKEAYTRTYGPNEPLRDAIKKHMVNDIQQGPAAEEAGLRVLNWK